MKIVIADDENPVRYALRSMIGEMDASWTIAGETSNGEGLLGLLSEHRPNVAIVDIRMPGMDGLEAIRRGKLLSPMTKWIILSGYSDFRFAQEALKLGASEYMLKPVGPEELERALYATYKDGRDLLLLHNERFGCNLSALVNGLISVRLEDREGIFHQGSFMGAVFELDRPAGGLGRAEAHEAFYRSLTDCLEAHLHSGVLLAVVTLPGGELAAVSARESGNRCGGKRQAADFFEAVKRIAASASGPDEAITVLMTGECRGFKELGGRLSLLQRVRDLRFFCGFGEAIEYEAWQGTAGREELLAIGRLLSAGLEYLQDRQYLNFQNALSELEPLWSKWEIGGRESEKRSLLRYLRHAAAGIRLPEDGLAEGMIVELRSYGEKVLREGKSKEDARHDVVAQVLRHIERHYAEEVGIGQLADLLNVSPSYLSTQFHKKTGMTFMKYLTQLRMGKAEELLIGTRLQIKQIAEEVGYFSTRHFTKLFTEAYGKYPSDYRKPV
ncbi:helix-turn-helix domain-containing protein [Paenibacillus glycinis]|uniref:Helix-turn-helix domain-containing protein n=1 Tax=Paenibacillus glycinis TaxID=2697035 RepID=A0ABW9XLH4_9BACL|nr:helix-turn-helix domain-containing protein [Paenibacillus glycinis]NBD23336.1 helix-turn-helix domain-containing protein [Paenibacillus glycinis]